MLSCRNALLFTCIRSIRGTCHPHGRSRALRIDTEGHRVGMDSSRSLGPAARPSHRSSTASLFSVGRPGFGKPWTGVCGENCESVERLVKEVEVRMDSMPRRAPQFDRKFLLQFVHGSMWRLPEHTRLHCLHTDEISRRILASGSLYPCKAITLVVQSRGASFYSGLYCEAIRNPEQGSCGWPFLIVKEKGVLLRSDITSTERETLIGPAEVVQRIEQTAPIRYLTKEECEEIASLDVHRSYAKPDLIALSA